MESTLVAALVAAMVSALGLLVQMQIARGARKISREQSALQSLSEIQKQAYMNLARLERESERLRINSWEIEGGLIEYISQRETEQDQGMDELRKLLNQFANQAHDFANLWADIRPDIPSKIEVYVRTLRHECLNNAKSLLSSANNMSRIDSSGKKTNKTLNLIKDILVLTRKHRFQLDELSKAIKAIRESLINPNNQFEITR